MSHHPCPVIRGLDNESFSVFLVTPFVLLKVGKTLSLELSLLQAE